MPSIPLCEVQHIKKEFVSPHGQILSVLEDVNFSISSGEIVAIIGPSGCGKSTLLRVLAGLERASKGEVLYLGERQEGLLPDMTLVFQSFALYPWMTVWENIAVVLKAKRLSDEEIVPKIRTVLSLIGLTGFEEAYPKEISGGMKQRVGIARALVCDPKILLMDEPFSALDSFTGESLRAELLSIWAKKELKLSSIVLISHDIREVVQMADRILVMKPNPGHIALTVNNTLSRPRDPRSAEFLNLVEDLHHTYYPKMEEKVVVTPSAMGPLLPVGVDEIRGLLEHLRHKKGEENLYKIGASSEQPFYKTINVVQATELLNFVEIRQRTVFLTETGRKYLAAQDQQARLIWRDQLLTIPVFAKIHHDLQKSGGMISKEDLLHFFAAKFPNQDAYMQCRVFSRWGVYGHLFSYHTQKKAFSLYQENSKKWI